MIEPAQMMTQGVVNYYFPVEVVIVGSLPEEERAAIEARIWGTLGDAFERMSFEFVQQINGFFRSRSALSDA